MEQIRKLIIEQQMKVAELISGVPAVMKEEQAGGDWVKELMGSASLEGKDQNYLRGYYDGLKAALEIMEREKNKGS